MNNALHVQITRNTAKAHVCPAPKNARANVNHIKWVGQQPNGGSIDPPPPPAYGPVVPKYDHCYDPELLKLLDEFTLSDTNTGYELPT